MKMLIVSVKKKSHSITFPFMTNKNRFLVNIQNRESIWQHFTHRVECGKNEVFFALHKCKYWMTKIFKKNMFCLRCFIRRFSMQISRKDVSFYVIRRRRKKFLFFPFSFLLHLPSSLSFNQIFAHKFVRVLLRRFVQKFANSFSFYQRKKCSSCSSSIPKSGMSIVVPKKMICLVGKIHCFLCIFHSNKFL